MGYFSSLRLRLPLALALALLAQAPAGAHEFWLAPVTTPLVAGQKADISLLVGEYFSGVLVGFSAPQTVALRMFSAAGRKDLQPLVPAKPVASVAVQVPADGAYVVAYDSQPSVISLPGGRFHAYVHDEGLDFVNQQREAAGNDDKPGRERYRRFVKTFFRVGEPGVPAAADQSYAARAGQRLEMTPLADPLALKPGDDLAVRVVFDDKPLPGALLKAWHKRGGQTLMIRAVTGADGSAVLNLPYAGPWMISTVHMVPVVGNADIDWDSLWGSLSFVVGGARP